VVRFVFPSIFEVFTIFQCFLSDADEMGGSSLSISFCTAVPHCITTRGKNKRRKSKGDDNINNTINTINTPNS
jgi:hypothetical protein